MNQDHLSQQPKADKYLTGDPSTFAEDITEPNTWDREYAGGATRRDEIGLAEFRPETFNHAEKTASMDEATLIKKADLCAIIARHMLKGRKFATEAAAIEALEKQSVALMYMPNADLIETASRVSAEEDFPGGQFPHQQEQQAAVPAPIATAPVAAPQQQMNPMAQCIQALQKGDAAGVQAGINQMVQQAMAKQVQARKAADEAQQGQQQGQQGQQQQAAQEQQQQQQQDQQQQAAQEGQQQGQQGQQQMEQQALEQMLAQAVASGVQAADYDAKKGPAINPPGYGPYNGPQTPKLANDQQGQPQQGQPQQQQGAGYQQQQDQQQQQQQQQAVQQVPQQQAPAQQQQQQQQADDLLLDDMLGPQQGGMNEMDIEMESPTMDTGEIVLSATDDEVLKTLFANQETQDAEQAQQAQAQQKQAGMSRTASANPSTRTIGTRPTVGVSKVGGAQAPNTPGSVDGNLSNLWASAPDVREAFGIR
jgi:hypothetical protein